MTLASPCFADIFVKRLADGTLSFSNCPLGKEWKVYIAEKAEKPKVYRNTKTSTSKKGNYKDLVDDIASVHGLDPSLIKSVIEVESGYDPYALSSKGAMGLMQLMPNTAHELGVSNPWDPEENINGGTKYLSWLLKKYKGDLVKTLAAYNAGPSVVDTYNGIPPYQETKEYVKSVMAILNGGGNVRE